MINNSYISLIWLIVIDNGDLCLVVVLMSGWSISVVVDSGYRFEWLLAMVNVDCQYHCWIALRYN